MPHSTLVLSTRVQTSSGASAVSCSSIPTHFINHQETFASQALPCLLPAQARTLFAKFGDRYSLAVNKSHSLPRMLIQWRAFSSCTSASPCTIEHSDNNSFGFRDQKNYSRCLLAFHSTSNLDRGSLFFWPLPLNLLGMGGPIRVIKLQPTYIHTCKKKKKKKPPW